MWRAATDDKTDRKIRLSPLAAAGLVTAAGGLALTLYSRRQKKLAAKKKLEQLYPENDSQIKPRPPGHGAPLLTGVRVVELATVVAGPCCGRLLGDFGAEVIKIEEPKGDTWRYFFLQFEPSRVFSSAFESINYSKKSVALDLKQKKDLQKLKEILKDADVFIVNTRVDSLKKLGLTYDQIKDEFPHLIYALVTAWGDRGPDASYPGYDIGAFWAATGLAARIQKPGCFPTYSTGFGDNLLSSFLFSSIQLGLIQRMKTGRGQFFTSSLFNLGIWCQFPAFVKPIEPPTSADYSKPPENPFYTTYRTKDDKFFGLLGFGEEERLKTILDVGSEKSGETLDHLAKNFREMTYSEVSSKLKSDHVGFAPVVGFMDFVKADLMQSPWRESNVFTCLPSDSKIVALRGPFDIHCSDEHDIKCKAPRIGQSTKSFLETGWSPIDPKAAINRTVMESEHGHKLLCGFEVVVLPWRSRASALMTGKMLTDRGAAVTVFQTGKSYVQTTYPEFHAQLTRDLTLVDYDKSTLLSKLSTSHVLITDIPTEELRNLEVDFESLHRVFPKLIFGQSSLFSSQGNQESSMEGDLGPFWAMSGFGENLCGKPPAPISPFPSFLGDLLNSVHLLSAVSGGLFHLLRTDEGVFTEASLFRAATFAQIIQFSIVRNDPRKIALLQVPHEKRQESNALPACGCFETKDGYWLQLLGVDGGRHLPRLLAAFGIKYLTYWNMMKIVLFQVLPSKEQSLVLKMLPVFVYINNALKKKFASMTFKEAQAFMAKHDLWYCPVNTVALARHSKQAEALGIFEVDPTTNLTNIKDPVEFK